MCKGRLSETTQGPDACALQQFSSAGVACLIGCVPWWMLSGCCRVGYSYACLFAVLRVSTGQLFAVLCVSTGQFCNASSCLCQCLVVAVVRGLVQVYVIAQVWQKKAYCRVHWACCLSRGMKGGADALIV
jgi:hypothetical protein